jgi:hypothetical protein
MSNNQRKIQGSQFRAREEKNWRGVKGVDLSAESLQEAGSRLKGESGVPSIPTVIMGSIGIVMTICVLVGIFGASAIPDEVQEEQPAMDPDEYDPSCTDNENHWSPDDED